MLPPSKRPLGLALFGITATLAPAVGPYIGGLLTDSFGWPAVQHDGSLERSQA
jgi:MFS transporter, DHA2 family, multidrug resistance protein